MAASGAPRRARPSGGGALIFLTVGTQLPFDRLVRAVDLWAGTSGQGRTIFGQIAEPGPAGHVPRHFDWVPHLAPEAFRARLEEARLVVAHAGMGSILAALTAAKPILILPRKAALGEQRNDHQIATARHFAARPGVTACDDAAGIGPGLDRLTASDAPPAPPIGADASPELVAALRQFIAGG